MSNVALAETPILSFLNNAGQLNAGGTLLTQVGGVNYPTYQDAAGATALPNPIPLNSRGEISNTSGVSCQLFLLPGIVYVFTLFDASGNQLWTANDVMAIAPATGAMTDENGLGGTPGFAAGVDFTAGTTTTLTLSRNYGSASNLWIAFDAGEQGADTFSISGTNNTTLTFNAPIPLGTNKVFVKGGTTTTIGTPGSGTVTDISVATGSKLSNRITDLVDVRDFGAKGNGVADDTAAFNAALGTGKMVYAPAGTYKITATLTIAGPGLYGDGETTNIQRSFTGGRLIAYPGGNPIYLRDFQLSTASTTTVANGDTGIDIGFSSSWAGRGEIANLLISGQWDGFKWAAGTAGPISNVQCLNNMGNGFFGTNARMEFYDCLSQSNAGNGYYLITTVSGQTGVSFTRCGTFANQGYGFIFTASAGLSGANVNLVASGTSFDGEGGIFFAAPYLQIWMSQMLCEYSGFANQFNPTFSVNASAVGLQLGACTNISGSDIQALNNAGAGVLLDHCTGVSISGLMATGNGTGAQGGATQAGVNFNSNNVGVVISGMLANSGVAQLTDISVGASNDINLVSPVLRTYFTSNTSTVRFVGRETTASNSVPSATAITLPDYYDFVLITGTTNISTIGGSMYPGRTVKLRFVGALTLQNTGNVLILSPITTVANQVVTLVTDGVDWYGA